LSARRRRRLAVGLLLHGALALLWAATDVVGHLLTLHELHRREVEDEHIVQLLSQLEDAAEDVHSVVICNGCVSAAGQWVKVSLPNLNLSPGAGREIELPEVVELVVIVVLATKHVELAVVDGRGGRSARLGALVSSLLCLADGALNGLVAGHSESAKLIYARAVDEAAEDEEGTLAQIAHHVVIARQHLLRGVLHRHS